MGLLAVLPAVVVGGGLVSLVGTVGRGIMGFLSGSGDEEEEEKTRKGLWNPPLFLIEFFLSMCLGWEVQG